MKHKINFEFTKQLGAQSIYHWINKRLKNDAAKGFCRHNVGQNTLNALLSGKVEIRTTGSQMVKGNITELDLDSAYLSIGESKLLPAGQMIHEEGKQGYLDYYLVELNEPIWNGTYKQWIHTVIWNKERLDSGYFEYSKATYLYSIELLDMRKWFRHLKLMKQKYKRTQWKDSVKTFTLAVIGCMASGKKESTCKNPFVAEYIWDSCQREMKNITSQLVEQKVIPFLWKTDAVYFLGKADLSKVSSSISFKTLNYNSGIVMNTGDYAMFGSKQRKIVSTHIPLDDKIRANIMDLEQFYWTTVGYQVRCAA